MWAEWVGMTAAMCSPMALPSMPPPPASWRITGVLVDAQAQPKPMMSRMLPLIMYTSASPYCNSGRGQ